MTRVVEVIEPTAYCARARVRMNDAAGWLYVARPNVLDHWCLVAVELDGDEKRPVGVVPLVQSTTAYGVSAEIRDALNHHYSTSHQETS